MSEDAYFGYGADIGGGWTMGPWQGGLVLRNLVNGSIGADYEWRESLLVAREDTSYTETADSAGVPPTFLARELDRLDDKRQVVAGLAYEADMWTVGGELRVASSDRFDLYSTDATAATIRGRVMPARWVDLDALVTASGDHWTLGTGLGLNLGLLKVGGDVRYRLDGKGWRGGLHAQVGRF